MKATRVKTYVNPKQQLSLSQGTHGAHALMAYYGPSKLMDGLFTAFIVRGPKLYLLLLTL